MGWSCRCAKSVWKFYCQFDRQCVAKTFVPQKNHNFKIISYNF